MTERPLLDRLIAEVGGPEAFADLIAELPEDLRVSLAADWRLRARPDQLPPAGEWLIWLILAGRGWGKTETGARFVHSEVRAGRAERVAIVAATAADARDYTVEGDTGILRTAAPGFPATYEPSKRRITWLNGSVGTVYTAEEPDRLRSLNASLVWMDEFAAYEDPEAMFTQAMLVLRKGQARMVITTTPRPLPIIKRLIVDPDVHVTRGRTADNHANLAPSYLRTLDRLYSGTRLGRQELEAEILEDNPNALWDLASIEAARVKAAPELRRLVVAVDPAVTAHEDSDETGIVVMGSGLCECRGQPELHGFVLEDASGIYRPTEWARRVRSAFDRHRADLVIVEVNQGGDLVESTLAAADARHLPVKSIHATRGKLLRAEGPSSLAAQGKVHHVGTFRRLEDQLCQWNPVHDRKSPDRVDAYCYAATELLLDGAPGCEPPEPFEPPEELRLYRRR